MSYLVVFVEYVFNFVLYYNVRLHTRSTRTDTLCPDTTLFRSRVTVLADDWTLGGQTWPLTPMTSQAWPRWPRASGRTSTRSSRAMTTSSPPRSEEHTSELQSLMLISYAVFCLNKKTNIS